MTFTYSGTSITTDLAKVRLEIGDTVEQTYSLTDEEIAVAQAQTSSVLQAAIICAQWRLTRLSDYIAQSAGGTSQQTNQKFEQFKQVLESLKKRASMGGVTPYAGGISTSRNATAESDSDFAPPAFKVGMDDIEGAGDDD